MPSKKTDEYDPQAIEVGKRLALVREKGLGYTVKAQFARFLDISPQRLNAYEKGKAFIPPEILIRLYDLTGVDTNYLFLNKPEKLPADIYSRIFGREAPPGMTVNTGRNGTASIKRRASTRR